MKSIILIFTASFIMLVNLRGQWEIVNEGINYNLITAIDFINSDTGWIAGNNVILQTTDGGKNWRPYETDTTGVFSSIDFINDSLGWAISESGILKTTDGGQNWFMQNDTVEYGYIFAVTESVIYAVKGGEILKTSTGGADWANIYSPSSKTAISAACFLDNDTGIFAGGSDLDDLNTPHEGIVLRTFNGGESWNELTIPEFNNVPEVKLLNDSTAFFLASDKSGKFYICKTTDAFATWSVLAENDYPIRAAYFFNDDVIIYIMEDNSSSYIMKSTDGGLTWGKNIVKLPLNWNYRICFGSEAAGYVFGVYLQLGSTGNAHTLMKSTDLGNSWSCIELTQPFQDVSFINGNTGIIVGCDAYIHYRFGIVFKTDDGGKTWNSVFSGNTILPVSCQFPNDSDGFILTYNYEEDGRLGLLQTLNSGESWIENSSLIPYPLPIWGWIRDNGRLFMNESSGYVAGKGRIYQTKNEGESWDVLLDCSTCELNSIYFTGESVGWAVGEGGRILKHTAPDKWDDITSGTDLPLKKVFFADENTGWIAGGYKSNDEFHPVLLKTENSGVSWINIVNVDYLIHDIYFKDNRRGWIVGEDKDARGIILETTDGGDSWSVEVDSLSAPLNAIHSKDGNVWAVGFNGYILKMHDSTLISGIEQHYADNNGAFLLENYPNPFSSNTVISYHLPVAGEIELSVYNLMGQKVTTLVKEKQPAGSYEVKWNAEGIESGVCFCELKTGAGRRILKMILFK
jgi:photosystem II stability/assembly factor-like uncharacterized protein